MKHARRTDVVENDSWNQACCEPLSSWFHGSTKTMKIARGKMHLRHLPHRANLRRDGFVGCKVLLQLHCVNIFHATLQPMLSHSYPEALLLRLLHTVKFRVE